MEWQRDFEHTANNCAWWEVTNEHTANNCAWWEVINWMTSSSLWMKKNHYMVGQSLHIFYSFLLSHQYVWYKSIFVCLLYRLTFRSKMQDDIPWHFMMFHVYPTKLDFVLEILLFIPTLLLVTLSHLPIGIQSVTITVHRREKRRWTMWPLRTQCGRRGQRLYMAVLYQLKFHSKPGLFLVMFSN